MAVEPGMFLFEVVVSNVRSFAESRHMIIRSEFGDVFSLELKDPKYMNIVIPEAPPLPEPPAKGKKGKKKKPKPKKKGKKGKKVKEVEPPPPPLIQSGQSVLFTSTPDFLLQTMKKFPLEVSLWSNEDYLTVIGNVSINWDPKYLVYLENILKCQEPPPVTVLEEYNVREEKTAKLIAQVGLQIKLSYLKDKVTTSFRCLSEDLSIKKFLYTGLNNKVTSYMCTLKTPDEAYLDYETKIKNIFIKDKPVPKITYAEYTNAPGANLFNLSGEPICCMDNADKPPDIKYKAPDTMPDIDFIIEYVRKIIASCNDSMRMLTPRPTIKPRIKATDIDKLCYCQETGWPTGDLGDRFKHAVQSEPCPICLNAVKKPEGPGGLSFDVANIRGPCGKPDCKVARRLRLYISDLIEEDNKEFDINDIIGPCGNKDCNVANKVRQFLRREGVFSRPATLKGLSTRCACVEEMKAQIEKPPSCLSICEISCEEDSEDDCGGKDCPFSTNQEEHIVNYFTVHYNFENNTYNKRFTKDVEQMLQPYIAMCDKTSEDKNKNVDSEEKTCPFTKYQREFIVNYFTVQYNFENELNNTDSTPPPSVKSETGSTKSYSATSSPVKSPETASVKSKPSPPATPSKPSPPATPSKPSPPATPKSTISTTSTNKTSEIKSPQSPKRELDKFKKCGELCPSRLEFMEETVCSKDTCGVPTISKDKPTPCKGPICPSDEKKDASPSDSKVVIDINEIKNLCCLESCDVADKVKDFIREGIKSHLKQKSRINPCLCDCTCDFKFTKKTTYCAVCDGYQCLGNDIDDLPAYAQPFPCPLYHKIYDKENIKSTRQAWPEENEDSKEGDTKGSKKKIKEALNLGNKQNSVSKASKNGFAAVKDETSRKSDKVSKEKGPQQSGKAKNGANQPAEMPVVKDIVVKKKKTVFQKYPPYPKVPGYMGWNYKAEDIPGMKPRPKWKPGAATKFIVRKYKMLKDGPESVAKKKRDLKKKKVEDKWRPTVVITKHNGDYTVQMEVIKKFSKERLPFQYPYEDKPPVIYTIGKTKEEIDMLKKQRDRKERRETRRKSKLLQSTFKDRCQEICVKAYNQAMGILPTPNPNSPECPCVVQTNTDITTPPIDSCSCSDEDVEVSDSDGDSWIIEFTPPVAKYDVKAKHPPVLADGDSQYTYLDYKVKLLDKNGKDVPRYFMGPDGKQQCSDLGGFWGPGKVWLEINKDGYIGPDGRWVPMTFIGPDGGMESAREGQFTDKNGQILKIGVDGYIDKEGKWAYYKNKKNDTKNAKTDKAKADGGGVGVNDKKELSKQKQNNGMKGDAAKTAATKAVTTGAGAVGGTVAKGGKGNDLPLTPNSKVRFAGKNRVVMRAAVDRTMHDAFMMKDSSVCDPWTIDPCEKRLNSLWLCESEKKKYAKYNEIMKELNFYGCEYKPLVRNNRASNTIYKKISPVLTRLY